MTCVGDRLLGEREGGREGEREGERGGEREIDTGRGRGRERDRERERKGGGGGVREAFVGVILPTMHTCI